MAEHDEPMSDGFEGDRTYVPPEMTMTKGRLELLIFGQDTFVRHPVPDVGTLTLGRADQCDVRVDDASISRQHALLHISDGDQPGAVFLHVEDLGSSNGTKVRGERLEPNTVSSVSVGEVVDLGLTMMIVQRSATAGRPRRLWTHGYFEVRLEEECERAQRSGANFAVVRILLKESRPSVTVEETLTGAIRPFDLLATYAPGEYELLLVDITHAQSDQIIAIIERGLAERGVDAAVGTASYPQNGRAPEALVAKAGARVRGIEKSDRETSKIVVVQDGAMQNLYKLIDRVAPSGISVLILGETGVGKEVVAEAVHTRSGRNQKAFLRLNCAALSETLLESELFGHERGAFTGAVQAKLGLLETAEGGTVFLDEVGELPMSTQVKLLRVIEERQVLRVGSLQPRSIDVRFISATNRDLEAEIQTGNFRKDLYYRLNGISVVIPPLRERPTEIEALAYSFAEIASSNLGYNGRVEIEGDSLELLKSYCWPGNIRELRNVMERAVLLAGGDAVSLEHLPVEKLVAAVVTSRSIDPFAFAGTIGSSSSTYGGLAPHERFDAAEATSPGVSRDGSGLHDTQGDLRGELETLERKRIMEALERCGGNQTQAAKVLGMSRRTLVSRLDAYEIPRPRKHKG